MPRVVTEPSGQDVEMEDDYDEEADSDFEAVDVNDDAISSSGEENDQGDAALKRASRKKRKIAEAPSEKVEDLEWDSGDEATVRAREKTKRKQKKGQVDVDNQSEDEEQGWRAKTRAMREQERVEKKKSKLASIKSSTIDVDKLWAEMNEPDPPNLPPATVEISPVGVSGGASTNDSAALASSQGVAKPSASNGTVGPLKEKLHLEKDLSNMITIKRTYRFAGEVHTEEKTVLRSSAEAQLWLAQRESKTQLGLGPDARPSRRPLRKISRFDPNLNNLGSMNKSWSKQAIAEATVSGPSLNTVEKSKQDWAAHVDDEGLQEELDKHAKSKDAYLQRKGFLQAVEQQKDEEARLARLKG